MVILLEGDRKCVMMVVFVGMVILVLMFILWDVVVFGSVDAGAIDVDFIGVL